MGALNEPLLPLPNTGGRPKKHPRREVVNAMLYVLRTGCAWRQLPHDLAPWQTVYWYFRRWRDDGTVQRLHDVLRDRLRDTAGRFRWARPRSSSRSRHAISNTF